jgi:hypothetical protein
MEKKLKYYAIEHEVGEQLIQWGLQSRKEGMNGAGKSRRAQLRFVCNELLDIAKKQEKNLQPIIQRPTSEDEAELQNIAVYSTRRNY